MRRLTTTLLAAALPLTLLAFTAGEGEPVTADPMEFVFHLHGDSEVPLTDDEVYASSGNQVMDTLAPTGDAQTRQLLNGVVSPNTNCSENALFPTWVGYIGNGTIVGDATLSIDVVGGTGGDVEVRVWTDTTGGCNDASVAPHITTMGTLPVGAGTMEVTIPTDGLDPLFEMKVMFVAADTSPTSQGRFVYDSAEFDATISFTCQPDEVTYDDKGEASHEPNCLPF